MVDNTEMLVVEVDMFVEGMVQMGKAVKDRQWSVVGEHKDLVHMQSNLPVEVGTKEKEMESKPKLRDKELLLLVGWCNEGHRTSAVQSKEPLLEEHTLALSF